MRHLKGLSTVGGRDQYLLFVSFGEDWARDELSRRWSSFFQRPQIVYFREEPVFFRDFVCEDGVATDSHVSCKALLHREGLCNKFRWIVLLMNVPIKVLLESVDQHDVDPLTVENTRAFFLNGLSESFDRESGHDFLHKVYNF